MKKEIFFSRQKGLSLVELMVGVLIGLLTLYAIYHIYGRAETSKRNVQTVGDAQINGLYTTFLLGQELSNAGAIVMSNQAALAACRTGAYPALSGAGPASLPLYPLPAAIRNVSSDFDELFIFYGTATTTDRPITIQAVTGASAAGAALDLQAPLGVDTESTLVAVAPSACEPLFVTNSVLNPGTGITTVTVQGNAGSVSAATTLIDLGKVVRRSFYVDAAGTLQMRHWQTDAAGQWVVSRTDAITPNVRLFRAQYGVDANDDGVIEQWVPATATGWNADAIQAAPIAQVQTIKAVRLALVVQADQPDKALAGGEPYTKTFFSDCPGDQDCPDADIIKVNIAQNAAEPYGWRYRGYETTIALKNAIWNTTVTPPSP